MNYKNVFHDEKHTEIEFISIGNGKKLKNKE